MTLLERMLTALTRVPGFRHPSTKASGPEPLPVAANAPGLTIQAGWLIDGSGGSLRRNVRIETRNGLLQTLEGQMRPDAEALSSRAQPDLDFSGCTLLPGLIDSHVHLTMTGSVDATFRAHLRDAPFEVVRQTILGNLREHLRCGVIAVRDGGGARANALRFSKSGPGRAQPVRVLAAGRAWHRPGRYGRLIGRSPASGLDLAQAIRLDGEPADHVKIVNSGLNSLTEYGRQTAAQFDAAEMSAAVRAAAERGLSVMVHANGEAPVRVAVTAGCGSVEHGFFMGRDNLNRLADTGVVWVPTAVTMQAYARCYQQGGRNPDAARRTLDHQLEQLALARRLGVRVALGTDSGSPGVHHGWSVVAEMKLLLQAGFTLEEAIRCASGNAGLLMGPGPGLLQQGSPATFIVVDGPPSRLPEELNRIRAVFINGVRQFEAGPCSTTGLPRG
jgi:imidazolonepropionase-like amidohydrolase